MSKSKRPFILITNDDGIQAPGIRHLSQSIAPHADVAIVAPQSEKSGCGMSITWTRPLHISEFPWENETPAWSINGTPADCIKMALAVLLKKVPDCIVSGINRGSNAGRTVLYSGTVGGVIEGALKNIPGFAFSFADLIPPPLTSTEPYIWPIVKYFLENPLPSGTFLNINFPYNSKDQIKGFRLAKQGRGYMVESPDRRIHPEGAPYYWLGGKWVSNQEAPDSDVAGLEAGYVTGVPIHISELTDHEAFHKHKHSIEALFEKAAVQK
ncbi:MAG: 5'/3'-nucleotidase SurE [Chlamydiia bacterium]|nr:5'/3'-nucleotidase SurE [Chlamydiia bacterium]